MLARLDFFGVRDFIYGGDPEWVRRRWFMVVCLSVGLLCTVAACVSTSLGRLPLQATIAVIDGYFTVIMVVVPGYLRLAAWDDKNKRDSEATVVETTVEASPLTKTTETVTTPPVMSGEPE